MKRSSVSHHRSAWLSVLLGLALVVGSLLPASLVFAARRLLRQPRRRTAPVAPEAANLVPTLLLKARQFAVFHDGGPDPATDQFSFNNSSLWGNVGIGRHSAENFSGGVRLNGNCVADDSYTTSNTPCNFWVEVPPNPSPTGDRYSGSNFITDLDPVRAISRRRRRPSVV